jgi:hypothetical protein
MAEILVEMRRPSVPMSGDLLFDKVDLSGGHWIALRKLGEDGQRFPIVDAARHGPRRGHFAPIATVPF